MGVVVTIDWLAKSFAISNLWLTNIRFDFEFALHTVNENFKVKFAHTADDCLASLFIGADMEGWIFFS